MFIVLSLVIFHESHSNSSYGLKIAEGLFAKHNYLEEIPLYAGMAWISNVTFVPHVTEKT